MTPVRLPVGVPQEAVLEQAVMGCLASTAGRPWYQRYAWSTLTRSTCTLVLDSQL